MKSITVVRRFVSNRVLWFRHASFKKKALAVTLLLIAVIIASQQIQNLTKPPAYTTQKVAKGSITETVTETGNIIVAGKADIYSPSEGVVEEVFVTNGDEVTEGQELFRVQSSATVQEQQAAFANYLTALNSLNASKSTLDSLRADMFTQWKTYRDLATNSTYENSDDSPNEPNRTAAEFHIAKDEWLSAEAKYKDQQTAIGQASADVNSKLLLYQATQDATVIAPYSGVVSNLSITQGSSVKAKTLTVIPSPVLLITENAPVEVLIELSESDITKVASGQKAEIDVSAITDKKYKAVVNRVDTLGSDKQGVIVYNVYLRMSDADKNIRPGMNIDAEIVTKKVESVISVPNSAIKPYAGGRAVRIPDKKSKNGYKFIPVVIGIRGNERTEIIEGLNTGDTVITSLSNEQLKRPGLFGN